MTKNAAAHRAQEVKPILTIVEPQKEGVNDRVINFKAAAEEAEAEAVPQMVTITEVIEKVNAEFNAKPEAPKAEIVPPVVPVVVEKVVLSIEEIKRKNEVLSRLTSKWDRLDEKRRRVENFSISHDGDTANAIIRDTQGEVFESNSPKTIGKLLEFWKQEFSEAIEEVEREMREIA